MRKLFILVLVFVVINSGSSFCVDLQTEYFTAEGFFHNEMYGKALNLYQEVLSGCGEKFKYHRQTLKRIIMIMYNQNRNKSIIRQYCFLYKSMYPTDEYTETVSKILNESGPSSTKNVDKPKEVVTKQKPKDINASKKDVFSAAHFKKLDSVVNRFQEGFWVKYEIDNLQEYEISGNYDKLTYAVLQSDVMGSKVNCKLLVLFEGPFKTLQLIYSVSFRNIDDYYVKEVTVRVQGQRTKEENSGHYKDNLPLGAAKYSKLMEDCTKGKSGYRNVKGNNIQFVEFNYDVDPAKKGYVFYSPQIPITGFISHKGKNPKNYTNFMIKLIDYGYSGGTSLAQ